MTTRQHPPNAEGAAPEAHSRRRLPAWISALQDFERALRTEPPPFNVLYIDGIRGGGHAGLAARMQAAVAGERTNGTTRPEPCAPRQYALLDFAAPSRGYSRPKDPLLGPIALSNQMRAAGFRFPLFDLACILHLHKTGQLTPERLRRLYPLDCRPRMFAWLDLVGSATADRFATEALSLIRQDHEIADTGYPAEQEIEALRHMHPARGMTERLLGCLITDLKADIHDARERPFVLFLQNPPPQHSRELGQSGADAWIWACLSGLASCENLLVVLFAPGDQEAPEPLNGKLHITNVRSHTLGSITPGAMRAVAEARALGHVFEIAHLADWAKNGYGKLLPRTFGLCADVAWVSKSGLVNKTDQVFDILPRPKKRQYVLVRKMLQMLPRDLAHAIVALSAARSFDASVFQHLAKVLQFAPKERYFSFITRLSFVRPISGPPGAAYRFEGEFAQLLQKYGRRAVHLSHSALFRYFRSRARIGEMGARAEALFHLNGLDWRRGMAEWDRELETALQNGHFSHARLLLDLSTDLRYDAKSWRARLLLRRGDYESATGQPEKALTYYRAADRFIRTFESESDEDLAIHPRAILKAGDAELDCGRPELALGCYRDAANACDAVLEYNPQSVASLECKVFALAAGARVRAQACEFDEADLLLNRGEATLNELRRVAPQNPATVTAAAALSRAAVQVHEAAGEPDALMAALVMQVEEAGRLPAAVLSRPEPTLAVCTALLKMADCNRRIGDAGEAMSVVTRAGTLLQAALGRFAGSLRLHIAAARYHASMARVYLQVGKFDEAKKRLSDGAATLRFAALSRPEDVEIQLVDAEISHYQGVYAAMHGHVDEARKALENARHILQALIAAEPQHRLAVRNLAACFIDLARCEAEAAKYNLAIEHFQTGIGMQKLAGPHSGRQAASRTAFRALLDEFELLVRLARFESSENSVKRLQDRIGQHDKTWPHDPEMRLLEAEMKLIVARRHMDLNRLDDASNAYSQAKQLATMAQDSTGVSAPGITHCAEAGFGLASVASKQGRLEAALSLNQETADQLRSNQWMQSNAAEQQFALGAGLQQRGKLLLQKAYYTEAAESFSEARRLFKVAGESSPAMGQAAAAARLLALLHLAEVERLLAHYRISYELFTEVESSLGDESRLPHGQIERENLLGLAALGKARIEVTLGRSEEAREGYLTAIRKLDTALASAADSVAMLSNRAQAHLSLADLWKLDSKESESRTHYMLAQKDAERILRVAPASSQGLRHQAAALIGLADLLRIAGHAGRAGGMYDQAVQICRFARTAAPQHLQGAYWLARALHARGRGFVAAEMPDRAREALNESIATYDSILVVSGIDVEVLAGRGQAYATLAALMEDTEGLEKFLDAHLASVNSYEKALEFAGDDVVLREEHAQGCVRCAGLLRRADRVQDALRYVQRGLKGFTYVLGLFPDRAELLFGEGRAHLLAGELNQIQVDSGKALWHFKAGIASFQKAAEQGGEDAEHAARMGEAYAAIGDLQYGFSQFSEAISHYQLAVEQYGIGLTQRPDDHDLRYLLAITLANIGSVNLSQGNASAAEHDYTRAISAYKAVLDADPGYARAQENMAATLLNLGNIFASGREFKRAKACYDDALAVNAARIAKDGDQADAHMSRALLHANIAEMYRTANQLEDAALHFRQVVESCEEVLEIDQDHASAQYNRGLAMANIAGMAAENGEFKEAVAGYRVAIEAYDAALALEPENVDALYNKGMTFSSLGQISLGIREQDAALVYFQNAIELFRQAYRLSPDDMQIREAGRKTKEILRELGSK